MKKWWSRNGLFVFGLLALAVATLVHERVNAEEKPNPLRAESFDVDRGDGRKQTITRFFDLETGFVCYTANWSENTDLMGRCTEVDGTDNRERIRKRYKKD